MSRRTIFGLLVGLAITVLAACGGGGGGGGGGGDTLGPPDGATLLNITVSPESVTIGVGSTEQFTATGMYSDDNTYDITSNVTWKSNDNTCVTIDSSGLAEALAPGNVTITADMDSKSGVASLSVASNAPTPKVVSTNPASDAVDVPVNATITATFNVDMNSSTIDGSTFYLRDGLTNVPGAVSVIGNIATFTPSADLELATTYSARVKSATSTEGQTMTLPYWWNFTTSESAAWTVLFGSYLTDNVDDIAVDGDGNIYVVGDTYGDLAATNPGETDIVLAKYNSSGIQQWVRQFGSSYFEYAEGVGVDSNGNVYVAGTTEGNLDGSSSEPYDYSFLAKYDTSGNRLWLKQFALVYTRDLAVDPSGNAYVWSTMPGKFTNLGIWDQADCSIKKFDSSGTELWTKDVSTDTAEWAGEIALSSGGDIYVTGSSGSGFLYKLDSSANVVWTNSVASSASLAVDSTGNYIALAGTTESDMDGYTNAGYADGFVVLFDSANNKLWSLLEGTTDYDYFRDVAFDAAGDIVITGYSFGDFGGITNSGNGDVLVLKYDTDGNNVWSKLIGSSEVDKGIAVTADSSNNIYVAGDTEGPLDGKIHRAYEDIFIMKYSASGVKQ